MRIILLMMVLGLSWSCLHSQNKRFELAGYTPDNYEVECAGIPPYGAKMLKIWGYGRKPDLAILQAKRNAVHAMIFRGAQVGECTIYPLVDDQAFADKHQRYFDEFFVEGGAYHSFVSVSGGTAQDVMKVKERGRKVYKASLIVVVRYDDLRKRLEEDIRLPSLTDRF